MKIVIYTCIYGEYEAMLHNHNIADSEIYQFDFICFTDGDPKFKYCEQTWKIINHCPCEFHCGVTTHSPNLRSIHNTALARCCPLEMPELADYDVIVYIDANAKIIDSQLMSDILDMRKTSQENGPLIVFSAHPWRNCYKAEAIASMNVEKFNNTDLERQINQYEEEGMPNSAGLFWNGFQILLHPKSTEMKPFYECYKSQLLDFVKNTEEKYHAQGQVALSYVLWKCNWLLATQGSHARLLILPQLFRDQTKMSIYNHGHQT